jgi:hypothetical protein
VRLVLFQAPLGKVDRVHVRAGDTIERATGLKADQVARLDPDDRYAIEQEMAKLRQAVPL